MKTFEEGLTELLHTLDTASASLRGEPFHEETSGGILYSQIGEDTYCLCTISLERAYDELGDKCFQNVLTGWDDWPLGKALKEML